MINPDVSKNCTVVLSGHNISKIANIAIKCIKYHLPELNNILYFNDFSSDEIADIPKLGVKLISWDVKSYEEYCLNRKYKRNDEIMSFRCSYILQSILKQIDTDYLFLVDGDLLILSDIFKLYLNNIPNYPVIGYVDYRYIHNPDVFISDRVITTKVNGKYCATRLHPALLLLNLKLLRELDIYGDTIDESVLTNLTNLNTDVFCDFFYKICSKNLRFLNFKYSDTCKDYFHITNLSSQIYLNENGNNTVFKSTKEDYIRQFAKNRNLKTTLSSIGVSQAELYNLILTKTGLKEDVKHDT